MVMRKRKQERRKNKKLITNLITIALINVLMFMTLLVPLSLLLSSTLQTRHQNMGVTSDRRGTTFGRTGCGIPKTHASSLPTISSSSSLSSFFVFRVANTFVVPITTNAVTDNGSRLRRIMSSTQQQQQHHLY